MLRPFSLLLGSATLVATLFVPRADANGPGGYHGGGYHGGAGYHYGGYYYPHHGYAGFGPYRPGLYAPYGFYRPYYPYGFGGPLAFGAAGFGLGLGLGYGLGSSGGYGGLGGYGGYRPYYGGTTIVNPTTVVVTPSGVPPVGGAGFPPVGGAAVPPLGGTGVPPVAGGAAPSQTQPPPDNAAHLQLVVPQNAEVLFNGGVTTQTGTVREFISPPLTTDKSFDYAITVRYTGSDGQPVNDRRVIHVRANDWFRIDFTRPAPPEPLPSP